MSDAADSHALDASVARLSSRAGWGEPTGRLTIAAICPQCRTGTTRERSL